MAQHVKILGILHIIFGALGVMAAVVVLLIFGGLAGIVGVSGQSQDSAVAVPIMGAIGGIIAVFLLIVSVPGLAAGIGLLQFKSWARILTLILSGLDLLSVPIGTALGIYGFWVLLNRETEMLFSGAAATVAPRV